MMILPPEDTRVDLEEVYGLHQQTCTTKTCKSRRSNCRLNPSCLQNIGKKKWTTLTSKGDSKKIEEILKDNERGPAEHAGLTNLGATCYVNSLLQLWFHNPAFRNAVYKWNPIEEGQDFDNLTYGTSYYQPKSPLEHLQVIFAFLQFGKRKIVDPTLFVVGLGLDSMIQQDAQEFSKLFLSLVEDKFMRQSDPDVNSLVQKKLRGTYEYVTKCLGCQSESCSQTPFDELNLNLGSTGRRSLEDSLSEFLAEEFLEGDNQYFCSVCKSRQNAVRRIRLIQLSFVLSFQLMRFVYDRNAGHKKKVHTPFQFPETIDMARMVEGSGASESMVYELRAVLIHQGSSAYSGHYIAHIYDSASGQWFKFNDEVVEKIEGRKLKLGNEDNVDGTKSSEKVKPPKGSYSSTNAYMLVYSKKGETSSEQSHINSLESLPVWLRDAVTRDNEEFTSLIRKQFEEEAKKNAVLHNTQKEIVEVYQSLHRVPDQSWEVVETSWLKKWLNQDPNQEAFCRPIDNTHLLCIHDKIYVEALKDLKVVAKKGAEFLFSKYGGGPRLSRCDLCAKCAAGSLARKKLKAAITDDAKRLTTLLRIIPHSDSVGAFWIGKESLRRWRRLATEKVENLFPMGYKEQRSKTPESKEDSGSGDDVKVVKVSSVKRDVMLIDDGAENDSEDQKEQELVFNEDIVCEHGNLFWTSEKKRLITGESWSLLKKYFPDAKEFPAASTPCPFCMESVSQEVNTRNTMKLIAKEQKDALFDLFRGKGRPTPCQYFGDLHLISREFLSQWRAFLRDPSRHIQPESLLNETLVCSHKGLLHLAAANDFSDSQSDIQVLREAEWDVIQKFVSVDVDVVLKCPDLTTVPAVCDECVSARTAEELERLLQYRNARIFVRILPQEEKKNGMVVEDDVEEVEAKRHKSSEVVTSDDPPLIVLDDLQSASRRSQRHRKTRGEKEIIVSSTDSLKDLKVKVMRKFSVATFDQRLFLNGKELVDSSATLSDLKVIPGSVVVLKRNIMPRVNLTNHVTEIRGYYAYHAPERGRTETAKKYFRHHEIKKFSDIMTIRNKADEPPEDMEIPVLHDPEEGFKGLFPSPTLTQRIDSLTRTLAKKGRNIADEDS